MKQQVLKNLSANEIQKLFISDKIKQVTSLENIDLDAVLDLFYYEQTVLLQSIPKNVTSLGFTQSNNDLSPEAIKIFAHLPESITSIDFGTNNFDSDDLSEYLIYLPAWIKSVTLNNKVINLDEFWTQKWMNLLNKLKEDSASHIDLGKISYTVKCTTELLIKVFKDFPENINSVNLNWISSGFKPEDLAKLFEIFPKNVSTLHLDSGALDNLKNTDLSILPKTITSLYIATDDFTGPSFEELLNQLKTLPQNITVLGLNESMYDLVSESFLTIINALPNTITAVDLTENLQNLSIHDRNEFLLTLPLNIQSLIINNTTIDLVELRLSMSIKNINLNPSSNANELSSYSIVIDDFLVMAYETQKNLLKKIPDTISNIRISTSSDTLSTLELKKLVSFPDHITSLDLGDNTIESNDLVEFFITLPEQIKYVTVNNKTYNLDEFWSEKWIELLKELQDNSTTHIDLGRINYGLKCSSTLLIKFLKDLPDCITSINFNWLSANRTPEDLIEVFKIFPKNILSLQLGTHTLDKLKNTGLSILPKTITSLYIELDDFMSLSPEDILKQLNTIPENITLLGLNETMCDFDNDSNHDICENIFKSLPKNITSVDLTKTFQLLSMSTQKKLLLVLPTSVKSVTVDSKIINLDDLRKNNETQKVEKPFFKPININNNDSKIHSSNNDNTSPKFNN